MPHTHDIHSDHEGQDEAQGEADDIKYNGVHDGSEGLLADSSQDATTHTLGGTRRGRLVTMTLMADWMPRALF